MSINLSLLVVGIVVFIAVFAILHHFGGVLSPTVRKVVHVLLIIAVVLWALAVVGLLPGNLAVLH